MGRRVEKKFAEGCYNAEYVSRMEPLGEDRKTQFVPETTAEVMAALGGKTTAVFLSEILNALAGKFGDDVWSVAAGVMYDIGRKRAGTMVRAMRIDDMKDARCLGRIMDLEDNNAGIKGEWVETGKNKAVKHEYDCPLADTCRKSPKVCSILMEAMERGTFEALGVKLKNPVILTKIIPDGDRYCEVRLELAE